MIKRILCFVASFMLFSVFTSNAKTVTSAANDSLLKQLDELIEMKEHLHTQKDAQLARYKRQLRIAISPDVKAVYHDSLFFGYLHYQADSALTYLRQKEIAVAKCADRSKDDSLIINKAEVLGVMGMYDDAMHLLKTVRVNDLDRQTLCYYYRVCRACYGWLADYSTDSEVKMNYLLKTQAYRDSILTIIPPGVERECVWAEKQCFDGKSDGVLQRLLMMCEQLPTTNSVEYIYLCYTIAEVYEMLGDTDREIYYLTLTAIGDMNASIREYASLQKLAQKMYECGDITRAYKYLTCSLEDAVACNARLRSIEVSQIYPIIEKKYKIAEKTERHNLRIMLVCVSLLSMLLLVAIFFLYRWMKKLSKTRQDLATAYSNLEAANQQLAQTGRIKEAYIARYLDRCVVYLDKLEAYRRSLAKLAMASRTDELYKAIKSEEFIAHERKEFYHEFDKSFLSLFPHFVDSFNELLQEDARLQPKSAEELTTELRIFALIRLGITDSSRIAHFLRYSLTTIYNYRSKLRNKAIDKDNFEQQILNL